MVLLWQKIQILIGQKVLRLRQSDRVREYDLLRLREQKGRLSIQAQKSAGRCFYSNQVPVDWCHLFDRWFHAPVHL